jgi:hypothetical protein
MSLFPKELEDHIVEVDGKVHYLNKTKTKTRCGLKNVNSIPIKGVNYSLLVCPICYMYMNNIELGGSNSLISNLEASEEKVTTLQEENEKMKSLIVKAKPKYIKALRAQKKNDTSKTKKSA